MTSKTPDDPTDQNDADAVEIPADTQAVDTAADDADTADIVADVADTADTAVIETLADDTAAAETDDTVVVETEPTTGPTNEPVAAATAVTAALPHVVLDKPAAPADPTATIPGSSSATAPSPAVSSPTASNPTHEMSSPADDAPSRRLRVATVVWGLMITAAGVWIIAWASGARIDAQLALICLLAAGGVALLVGSIVSGTRASRR